MWDNATYPSTVFDTSGAQFNSFVEISTDFSTDFSTDLSTEF